MSDSKKRFEQMLDYDLDARNAASGAFGKLYEQQQGQYLKKERDALIASGGTVNAATDNQLKAKFNQFWEKQRVSLKAKTMAAYNDESVEETANKVGGDFMERAGGVLSGGVSGMLLGGGDFAGGISHQLRHAALGAMMGIPFVGDFLAKTMAWAGSKVKALFGKGESLSWSEAGEKVERERIKERMGAQLGKYADVDKLADMVNRSGSEFSAEEQKKYTARPSAAPVPSTPAGEPEPSPAVETPSRGDRAAAALEQHLEERKIGGGDMRALTKKIEVIVLEKPEGISGAQDVPTGAPISAPPAGAKAPAARTPE